MEEKIMELIREVNMYADVDANTNLIAEGVLDSLSMAFLVEFLEQEYQFKMPEKELNPENFATVGAICDLVKRVRSV